MFPTEYRFGSIVITPEHVPGFARVLRCVDKETGIFGYIVVHTDFIPNVALGGCRRRDENGYPTHKAILDDVCRLARGMTKKWAYAADCDEDYANGAKCGFRIPSRFDIHAPEPLRAIGRMVKIVNEEGLVPVEFVTGEDLGTNEKDVDVMAEVTEGKYLIGTSHTAAKQVIGDPYHGNPSPYTAYGVYQAIKAVSANYRGFDVPDSMAIQGVGQTGSHLALLVMQDGVTLIVADENEERLQIAKKGYGARVVPVAEIHKVHADVLCPCAIGGILNDTTIPDLGAGIVVGSANNQLAEDRHADLLHELDVVYIPDYVANAGGIIYISSANHGWGMDRLYLRLERIFDDVSRLLEISIIEDCPPVHIADRMVKDRLRKFRK